MTISRRNWERFGDILAVVIALLLASVIVALAETADAPPTAQPAPPKPVKIELKSPRPVHLAAIPGPIAQDGGAGDAILAETGCLEALRGT